MAELPTVVISSECTINSESQFIVKVHCEAGINNKQEKLKLKKLKPSFWLHCLLYAIMKPGIN